ncbi:DNA translocase FtsK 4TM domain-containing protein [Patescibacteria group bacterium]
MPRGRRRKFKFRFKIRPDTVRSVIALVFLLLAIISLVSFFASSYYVNSKVLGFLQKIFGNAAIIFPFLLASVGALFVDKLKIKFKEGRILLSLGLMLFSLSTLFHIFISEEKAYEVAIKGGGGGLFGYRSVGILVSSVGKVSGVLIILILLVISGILLFNISFDRIIKLLSESKVFGKFIEILKKIFPFKKKVKEEGDVEVVDTMGSEELTVMEDEEEEDEGEPSFEIVPSMAEPQRGPGGDSAVPGEINSQPSLGFSSFPSDKIWQYPPLELLSDPPPKMKDDSDVEKRIKIIKGTLKSFGVEVEVADVRVGSSVTQYVVKPKSVTKISRISSLQDNLALALASPTGSVRIEAPIPGKSAIGIEVPNTNRTLVSFKHLITSDTMKSMKSKLGIVLGESVSGKVLGYDIGKMPHLLIAGTTGSGKSVFIHNLLFSILYRATPSEVKLIIVDPKRVELIHYQGIPHLLTPVVTDMEKAPSVFRWADAEVTKRYKLFEQAKVRNIDAYNEKSGIQVMPYILIVVDELSDIMTRDPAGIEKSIIRIAQLARATGIHLVMAVQRPSTDIITGLIKANIPCRAAFQVLSQVDSRVIIDQPGAEKLLGKGDMLFVPPDLLKPTRLQGAFISDREIESLVEYLKKQGMEPDYKEEVLVTPTNARRGNGSKTWGSDVDELFDDAVEIVISADKASASLLQRKLSIGYARAARIIDEMEEKEVIGPPVSGSRGREVLISSIPDKNIEGIVLDEGEVSESLDE